MKTFTKLAAVGLLAVASSTASAASMGIQDAWQFDTTGAGINSVTTKIGHLNLSGGVGYVNQSFGADYTLGVGDTFTEYGAVYSISVTKDNNVGANDSGFPVGFTSPLAGIQLLFSGLTGSLTSVSGSGAVTYMFNPGIGNIQIQGTQDGTTFVTLANLTPVNPSGGSLGAFLGGLLPNGSTDMLTRVSTTGYIANLFRDSTGASLDAYVNAIPSGRLFAAIHTQNTLGTPANCYTDGLGNVLGCNLEVNSDGSVNLTIPEPGSIALMGAGLLALVGFTRRRSMKS